MISSTRTVALIASLALLAAAGPLPTASAQVPIDFEGDEILVNTYTSARQSGAEVAADAAGDFIVVWSDPFQDGSTSSVFGRRYTSAGAPRGGELAVNTYTTGTQFSASVAAGPAGDFLVVWASDADPDRFGVFARRYDGAGNPDGPEFQINEYTTGSQTRPDIAALDGGGFVVAWSSDGQDGSLDGIVARRFDSVGSALGDEIVVNEYTTLLQSRPAVASLADGGFVVSWGSLNQDGDSSGVFARRFDAGGAPASTEFQVNVFTTGSQSLPDVAGLPLGGFVIVWSSDEQDGEDRGVFARRYASDAAPITGEIAVNTYTTADQSEPAVSVSGDGDVLVVWQDVGGEEIPGQDGSAAGLFGRRFRPAGAAAGDEFQVNSFTTSSQYGPAVAPRGADGFVASWSSDGQDGSFAGIIARRMIVPIDTTTTTTQSSTTSTTAEPGACSAPLSGGPLPVVTDCLVVLRVAIGLDSCNPQCSCAPSGVLPVNTTDALICIQAAVGQDVQLSCPC